MTHALKTAEDVLRAIRDDKVRRIDLRFADLPGRWHRFSLPADSFDLASCANGVGFDGSRRGFRKTRESGMLAVPDPASAFRDPFVGVPTLVLICNLRDPATGWNDARDARHIAQKAEAYLQETQIGDAACFGPELEYFLVDKVHDGPSANHDSGEVDTAAANVLREVRTQIEAALEKIGIAAEARPDGIAPGGRGGIAVRFTALTRMADSVMICRYVIDNVARRHGLQAAFMPQPPFGDGGPGLPVRMHVHQSLWYRERPLFAGDGYAGTSALMRHYIAGLLEHAPALLAICAPAAASRRRPMPDLAALIGLGHAPRNGAAPRHIPPYTPDPKARRVAFRCPDSSGNPYLACAAMLMAGIDGFHHRLYDRDPAGPIDKNIGDLSARKRAEMSSAPCLLAALAADHAFLSEGDVFAPDVIETFLDHGRAP